MTDLSDLKVTESEVGAQVQAICSVCGPISAYVDRRLFPEIRLKHLLARFLKLHEHPRAI